MNLERLESIYQNIHLADKSDMESVKQLTIDYPYYALPYVVLSKYYFDTKHYKFEDMLRQAAMRVKDRKALYEYIHSSTVVEQVQDIQEKESISAPIADVNYFLEETESIIEQEETAIDEPEAILIAPSEEMIEAPGMSDEAIIEEAVETISVKDFLADEADDNIIEQDPESPVIEELVEPIQKPEEFIIETHVDNRPIDKIEIDYDIIGEEIETEFAFSKSFVSQTELVEPELEEESNFVDNTSSKTEIESNESIDADIHLRKYPVYSLENYFKDEVEAKVEEVVDEHPSPERDFFAWLKSPKHVEELPTEDKKIEPKEEEIVEEKVVKSLDIIEKFIVSNPQISRPKKEFFNPENMAKRSEIVDLEFVTETLANIYYEQGNIDLAIRAYEKLSLQNPSKASYFADLIDKIKKERK